MNTELLAKVEKNYLKKVPTIHVGDLVEVHSIVREKNRQRIQVFKGLVIAIKGSGLRTMFTVRKISAGVGVEKIFPLHSPNVKKIVLTRKGNVRRSKLYYLRERIGKRALKVKTNEKFNIEDFYAVAEEPEEELEETVEAVETVESETTETPEVDETVSKDEKATVEDKAEKDAEEKPSKKSK